MLRAILMIVFVFLPATVGWATERVRYEDLPKRVKASNFAVAASTETVRAKRSMEGYFLRSFLPEIEAKGGHESLREGSGPTVNEPFWSVEGRLNLFRGLRDFSEDRVRRTDTIQSSEELRITERDALFSARKTYWDILALQTLVRLQGDAIRQNEENLTQARRRMASGITTSADPLEFEMNRTLLEQNLKQLILDLDLSKNNLSVLIGVTDHESMQIEGEFVHPPEDDALLAVELNLTDHPTVRSLAAQRDRAAMEAKKAATWWSPSLDAFSSYAHAAAPVEGITDAPVERDFLVGAKVTLNLFDALETHRDRRANTALTRSFSALQEERERSLAAKLHELKHDLKLHHELLHGANEYVVQAERFLNLTLKEYNRGVKNGPDVLQAATKKLESSKRAVELARGYEVTKAEILRILGE